jgi:hypothetical protein
MKHMQEVAFLIHAVDTGVHDVSSWQEPAVLSSGSLFHESRSWETLSVNLRHRLNRG